MSDKVYEIITEQVLKSLDDGIVPWHRPWKQKWNLNFPTNYKSKKQYRGINVWLTAFQPYDSPYWASFNQIKQMGGKVKKGEHGTIVVFWKILDKEETNNDGERVTKKIPLLRYYRVFNTDQCEGLDNLLKKHQNNIDQIEFNPIEKCEKVIANMPKCPNIIHNGQQKAYYYYDKDLKKENINMPKKESFDSIEEYYSTLFHELGHSTKHEARVKREYSDISTARQMEELVAEMTTAYICAYCGIENKTIDNSKAYIKNWSKTLKENKRMVVQAAALAQKAADYILNVKFNEENQD